MLEENSNTAAPQVNFTPGPPVKTSTGLPKGALFAIIGGGAFVLIVLIATAVITFSFVAQQNRLAAFPNAVAACAKNTSVEVMDEGRTLLIDGEGDDYGSGDISVAETACMLDVLNADSAVLTKMSETRALDGRQTATWDGITASWSYHPDNGLDILLELSK